MQLSEYLANIPRLHSWDNGATWNTGGFEASHLRALFDFLRTHACRRIVETGAGNSTLTFLLTQPKRVVSIAPEPALFERIIAYCDEHGISHAALERHVAGSQWVLPKIATEAPAEFDFALVDGAHGWPYVFIDFFYMHVLLRPGGHIMLDDVQLHSVSELIRWLRELSEYSLALALGKAVVFRKDARGAEFPEWNGQPYIIRLSQRDIGEQFVAAASPHEPSGETKAGMRMPQRCDLGLPGLDTVPETTPASEAGTVAVPGEPQDIRDRAIRAEQIDQAARNARMVVPLVMKLVRGVRSVVDVGCGAGVWLAQFKEVGVPRVLGLDRPDAERNQLEIDPEEFHAVDLEAEIDLDEVFDLCVCLEVAQHLSDRAAPTIIQGLCKLSDVVLFSAAIPGQGGTHHINERWPSYWANLFRSAGYDVLDMVRGRIWNDARVEWCYRQNLLLFANRAGLARIAGNLGADSDAEPAAYTWSTPLDVVHPACFELIHRRQEVLASNAVAPEPVRKAAALKYASRAYWENRKAKLLRSIRKRLS